MMHDPEIAASKVSLADMLSESKRELAMRKAVYPSRVANGKMKEHQAQLHLHRQEAIVKFFEWAVPREAALRALGGVDAKATEGSEGSGGPQRAGGE